MKGDDETPWWCQLLWPWFGRPWYAEIEDPDAFWAAIGRQFARQAGELVGDLAGDDRPGEGYDDRPGEGYLAKAGRLTAARRRAEEIIRHESGPPDIRRGGRRRGQDDEPASAGEWPVVIGRGHPSWPEVDAEQRERTGDPGWG